MVVFRVFLDDRSDRPLLCAPVARGGLATGQARLKGIMAAKASAKKKAAEAPRSKRKISVAPPAPPAPKPLTVEERVAKLEERMVAAGPEFQKSYRDGLDMSWIYHDSALEGSVYTGQELRAAIDPETALATDSSIQPICEEIRRHLRHCLTIVLVIRTSIVITEKFKIFWVNLESLESSLFTELHCKVIQIVALFLSSN